MPSIGYWKPVKGQRRDYEFIYSRRCECGGKIVANEAFGQMFSVCLRCTPVVKINLPVTRADAPEARQHENADAPKA